MSKNPKQITEQQLNDAAKLLADQLPDAAGQLMGDLAKEYDMALWKLAAGILLASHIEGRLSAFELDPAWAEGLVKQREAICKRCGIAFIPININQPYCSNECGLGITPMIVSPEGELETVQISKTVIPREAELSVEELGRDLTEEAEEALDEHKSSALDLLKRKHAKEPILNATTHNDMFEPTVSIADGNDSGWSDVDLPSVDAIEPEPAQPSA